MNGDSLLFIPDISGFTEFVKDTEITHSRHVISELLEVIMASDELGMTVSEIEGDAVVFFLQRESPSLSEVVAQVQKTFHAFHSHLKRYERDRICPCGACRTAHELTLKVVAHSGPIETIVVRDFEKPYGPDVILAHRLLKNDVPTREYALITDSLVQSRGELPNWVDLVPGSSSYESIGEVSYHHIPLGPLRESVPDPPDRVRPGRSARPLTRETIVPLPLNETFELVSNFVVVDPGGG